MVYVVLCSVYGVWYGAACMMCGPYDVWCMLCCALCMVGGMVWRV